MVAVPGQVCGRQASNPKGLSSTEAETFAFGTNQTFRCAVRAVLVEPFPWTVTQGVILLFVIVNSQLKVLSWLLSTHDNQLEP
jgi:hypothetical protein